MNLADVSNSLDFYLEAMARQFPNFQLRAGQRQMMEFIASALARSLEPDETGAVTRQGESIAVVEGPTGTGKSLGYLLPGLLMARAAGKKLVVSSGTVTLQEQLANNDIPRLATYAGLKVGAAIAKGRGRYLCTYRLKQQLEGTSAHAGLQPDLLTDILPEKNVNFGSGFLPKLQMLDNLLASGAWAGDRDALPEPIADAVWSQVTNDRHGCIKTRCAFLAQCPFFKARQALDEVDIIIANHDLLLADLAMGGGVILPAPRESFYCIDEAHHFAARATQQFAAAHALNGSLLWLEKTGHAVMRAAHLLATSYPLAGAEQINQLAETVTGYLMELRTLLNSTPVLKLDLNIPIPISWRFEKGILPPELTEISRNLAIATETFANRLKKLRDTLKRAHLNSEHLQAALIEKSLLELGFFCGRADNLAAVWNLLITENTAELPPVAKWITAAVTHNNKQVETVEYTINASLVRVGHLLAQRLWSQAAGAILTSATLRSLGSFNLLLTETGLLQFSETSCLALASPFDFQKQGRLCIPAMNTDPSDPVAHTKEIIQLLPDLIQTTGANGTLMLFSSKRQMLQVAAKLPSKHRELLLMQGEHSREQLLKKHFARIHAEQPSILFGLDSLAEGLDLPGNACNHLIIAKLPFATPDDPVAQTLSEWIAAQGKNPFLELTLPRASIKLIQAVGRLIRSEQDSGQVTILDTRFVSKFYGKMLRKSLPPLSLDPLSQQKK